MDVKSLVPGILQNEDGMYIAPVSTTNMVYTKDNEKVEDVLKEIKNTSNTVLYTKVQIIEATFEGQSIFNLKYPIDNYDITKFPVLVITRKHRGEDFVEIPSDYYKINQNYPNDDQILFNTSKVDAFKKNENVIVIYHYSDTIYNGSVMNAETINNTYVSFEKPAAGQQLPDPSVYFDFPGSQIIYYSNGVINYFPIGASQIVRATSTITSTTQEIPINIEGYNPDEDTLIVYENNIYIAEESYYVIDEELKMRKKNNIVWNATSYDPITFDFLVYKRSKGIKVGDTAKSSWSNNINDGTVSMDKLSLDLQETIKNLQAEIDELKSQINK